MIPDRKIAQIALLSLLTLSAAACDDDGDGDPGTGPGTQQAQLRIVNAANVADVQVRRVGTTTPLAQDLDFRGSSQSCVQVPAGEQALVFSAGGMSLATTAHNFEANRRYTAILVSSGSIVRALVVPDNETAVAGNNGLRFINATSTSGDVYVTPAGGAVGPTFRANGNLGVLATSNSIPAYVYRSTEHTQARLFDVGVTTGTPRADLTLTGIPASRLATVVFTDAGTPAGPTAFMVTPCP